MTETQDRGSIVFYCKDCEKVVATHRIGKKYVYKCAECGTKNVAFGTEKSIKSFFRIKEESQTEQSSDLAKSPQPATATAAEAAGVPAHTTGESAVSEPSVPAKPVS